MGTLVLLDLMGGVALLLWGLHMVISDRSGRSCMLGSCRLRPRKRLEAGPDRQKAR
jgi:Na+/phosphate symporter